MPDKRTRPEAASSETERIGAWFRSVRVAAGYSQRALAAELGIYENMLRWHEAGAVMFRMDVVAKAAEVLKVPISYLAAPSPTWDMPEAPAKLPYRRNRRA